MSLLSVSCRACRATLGGTISHAGTSCSFATTSPARQGSGSGSPLPSRDWTRVPRAGPSSSADNGRPAPRAPQRRTPSDQQGNNQGSGYGNGNGSGSGAGARRGRGQKIGWNGSPKPASSFGLRNRAAEGAPQEKKEDLTAHLKSWNLSVQSTPNTSNARDVDDDDTNRSSPRSNSRFSTPDADEDGSDRRSRFGDTRTVRESRGFEASRRTSQDGDFVINRNTRQGQGSKKGKEKESDHHRSPLAGDAKRPIKSKKGTEKVRAVEKEVYIPSTVTVSRLADIFGVKICMSSAPRLTWCSS